MIGISKISISFSYNVCQSDGDNIVFKFVEKLKSEIQKVTSSFNNFINKLRTLIMIINIFNTKIE